MGFLDCQVHMSRPKKIMIYFNYLIFICFLLQKFYKPCPSLISFPNPKENFPINLLGIIFKKTFWSRYYWRKGFIRGTFYVLIPISKYKKKYYKHRELFKERLYLRKGINREYTVNPKPIRVLKVEKEVWAWASLLHKNLNFLSPSKKFKAIPWSGLTKLELFT